jgi:hypothetical protein
LLAETEVLISNPKFGDIEAETEPELIWDRFKPVIPVAGIPNKFAPEPEKAPLTKEIADPLTVKDPVICALPICESEPVDRKLPLTIGLSMIITYTRLI